MRQLAHARVMFRFANVEPKPAGRSKYSVYSSGYGTAKKVRHVCDNLNTLAIGVFHKAFDADAARSASRSLGSTYTPQLGSITKVLKLAVQNLTRNNPLPEIANRLLDSINFHLTAGDRIALQGKSGAGKSLLMRAIMLGMILGNSLNAISLSIDRFRDGLHQDRERIENLLTLGATSWESSREIAADAIRVGLLPMINTMTVTGIVSLPGMMTGQLLSGVSPLEAVKYQIVILALIATTTTLGCLLAIGLTFKQSFSTWHALARS